MTMRWALVKYQNDNTQAAVKCSFIENYKDTTELVLNNVYDVFRSAHESDTPESVLERDNKILYIIDDKKSNKRPLKAGWYKAVVLRVAASREELQTSSDDEDKVSTMSCGEDHSGTDMLLPELIEESTDSPNVSLELNDSSFTLDNFRKLQDENRLLKARLRSIEKKYKSCKSKCNRLSMINISLQENYVIKDLHKRNSTTLGENAMMVVNTQFQNTCVNSNNISMSQIEELHSQSGYSTPPRLSTENESSSSELNRTPLNGEPSTEEYLTTEEIAKYTKTVQPGEDGDKRFIKNLALAVWTPEELSERSVTGMPCLGLKRKARPECTPEKKEYLKGLLMKRIKSSVLPPNEEEINRRMGSFNGILNAKISSLRRNRHMNEENSPPELPFEEMSSNKDYISNETIKQCSKRVLPGEHGDSKFVKLLASEIWTKEELSERSATGSPCPNSWLIEGARPECTPEKKNYLKGLLLKRIQSSHNPPGEAEIKKRMGAFNQILSKKISTVRRNRNVDKKNNPHARHST